MSVRTGMYNFDVFRTTLYPLANVPARTSTYHLVLPCTRYRISDVPASAAGPASITSDA